MSSSSGAGGQGVGTVGRALTKDSRDTLAEAGSGTALPRRGTLSVIRALIRNHLAAGPVVWWAAPQFVCTRTLTSLNQMQLRVMLGIAGSNISVSHFWLATTMCFIDFLLSRADLTLGWHNGEEK